MAATSTAKKPQESTANAPTAPAYAPARHNQSLWPIGTEDAVAHAKDKGEKHNKKAAQKSIKEKRAAKKAKKATSVRSG